MICGDLRLICGDLLFSGRPENRFSESFMVTECRKERRLTKTSLGQILLKDYPTQSLIKRNQCGSYTAQTAELVRTVRCFVTPLLTFIMVIAVEDLDLDS